MPDEPLYEPEPADDPLPTAGYRTYEVYQRERVGQTTNRIKPSELLSESFAADPYPRLEILREHYPCYRDWLGNRFWITRYDDVTSVFTDDANFESRSKLWRYGEPDLGRDLGEELPFLWARTNRLGESFDAVIDEVMTDLATEAEGAGGVVDLASALAGRVPLEAWGHALDLPRPTLGPFATQYWRLQRGVGWDPQAQLDGRAALDELEELIEPLLAARRAHPGDDVISAVAGIEFDEGPATALDLVVTLLELDHQTLHGALANLWFQLLTNHDQLDLVKADRRLMKFAYLETLRHSPAVLAADRYTRHEVERFGRLLPEGALLRCSASAANRDPRQFDEPDSFRVGRTDLCQREPRGQYRADGLPAGLTFGLGPPTKHPAVPKDRPVSEYALTLNLAVRVSERLLERFPNIQLADGAEPELRCLRLGEMHTCWNLPATLG